MHKLSYDPDRSAKQFSNFPGTRFMGSKNKILPSIWEIIEKIQFHSFFDAFAGSNVVGYFMKSKGKKVITNDFMSISYFLSKAIIENSHVTLEADDVKFLVNNPNDQDFIQKTFNDLYFDHVDNQFLDKIRCNVDFLNDDYKKAIALSALVRSCLKKRPRGVFTYTGYRYDDGRQDLKKSLQDHFYDSVLLLNKAVFDNHTPCESRNESTQTIHVISDFIYIDPPYFTLNSDNDYVRRYHFIEGLVKNWKGLVIQEHTKTKKFKSYTSPYSSREAAYNALEMLIANYSDAIIGISYSSNSLPTREDMVQILMKYKHDVEVHEIDHRYSFGNQNHKIGNINNQVKEYLFIAK